MFVSQKQNLNLNYFSVSFYLYIIYTLLDVEFRVRAHSIGSVRPDNRPGTCQAVYSIYDSIVKEGIQHVVSILFFISSHVSVKAW